MTQFDKLVTKGNERANELAKAGAMLDEGFMETRAKTVQQERIRSVCSFAVCGQFSLSRQRNWKDLKPRPKEKWIFVQKKSEESKHRTEWCANASKYSVQEKRKKQQVHENAREMYRAEILDKNIGKLWRSVIWEATIW